MTVKPPAINSGATAGLLSPTQGAENIPAISQDAVQWYRNMEGMLGKNYCGRLDRPHEHYAHVLDGTLHLMSRVLTTLPLKGTDGPPTERTYFALPMDFRGTCDTLRQVGSYLAPKSFRPDEIVRILAGRLAAEMYKFQCKVPSALVGYNFDVGTYGGSATPYISFRIYDCGNALMRSAGIFATMATTEIQLAPQPFIKVDLEYRKHGHSHCINDYPEDHQI